MTTMEDAARARQAAAAAGGPDRPGMVEALLAERRGYVTRGLADRVGQVDEQIRAYGGVPPCDDPEGPPPARPARAARARTESR